MKNPVNPKILPFFTLSTGVLGIVIRFWLFSTGIDDSGLLVTSHPGNTISFILTALTLGVLLLAVLNCPKSAVSGASKPGAAACWIAALGLLIADFTEMTLIQDTLSKFSLVLGILCAVCFVLSGLCRLQGKKTPMLAHILICVYFMAHLILQYRMWNTETQIQIYFFPLLASVTLMLYAYHRSMADQVGVNLRRELFFGQAALFFCCMSLNDQNGLFYLCMALWTALEARVPVSQEQEA